MKRLLLTLAPLALLAACGQLSASEPEHDPGAVYAVPMAQVQAALMRTDLPPLVFGDHPPRMQAQVLDDTHIAFPLTKSGAEVMRYIVTLEPAENDGTRVSVDLTGPESGRFGNVRERLAGNPSVRHLYLVAMREQIASDLERRPYDASKLYAATVAATSANIPMIMEQFDRAAEEDHRRARENIDKAYRDEAREKAY
jgi:hypothetical protein